MSGCSVCTARGTCGSRRRSAPPPPFEAELREAVAVAFDARLHPRDRLGRFRDVLNRLARMRPSARRNEEIERFRRSLDKVVARKREHLDSAEVRAIRRQLSDMHATSPAFLDRAGVVYSEGPEPMRPRLVGDVPDGEREFFKITHPDGRVEYEARRGRAPSARMAQLRDESPGATLGMPNSLPPEVREVVGANVEVGNRVSFNAYGRQTVGVVKKIGPKNAQVEISVGSGSNVRRKVLTRPLRDLTVTL